jgi:hypothetical protein
MVTTVIRTDRPIFHARKTRRAEKYPSIENNKLAFHSKNHLEGHELKNCCPILDIVQRELGAQDLLQRKNNGSSHDGKVLRLDYSVADVSPSEVEQVFRKGIEVRSEKGHGTVNHVDHGLGVHCKLGVLLDVLIRGKSKE